MKAARGGGGASSRRGGMPEGASRTVAARPLCSACDGAGERHMQTDSGRRARQHGRRGISAVRRSPDGRTRRQRMSLARRRSTRRLPAKALRGASLPSRGALGALGALRRCASRERRPIATGGYSPCHAWPCLGGELLSRPASPPAPRHPQGGVGAALTNSAGGQGAGCWSRADYAPRAPASHGGRSP